jgi:hypothetical protein
MRQLSPLVEHSVKIELNAGAPPVNDPLNMPQTKSRWAKTEFMQNGILAKVKSP